MGPPEREGERQSLCASTWSDRSYWRAERACQGSHGHLDQSSASAVDRCRIFRTVVCSSFWFRVQCHVEYADSHWPDKEGRSLVILGAGEDGAVPSERATGMMRRIVLSRPCIRTKSDADKKVENASQARNGTGRVVKKDAGKFGRGEEGGQASGVGGFPQTLGPDRRRRRRPRHHRPPHAPFPFDDVLWWATYTLAAWVHACWESVSR